MRKHIQLGLIIVIMFASFGWAEGNSVKSPESMEIRELRQELRRVVDARVAQGCHIMEVKDLNRLSKEAFLSGNRKEGLRLLRQALSKARDLAPSEMSDIKVHSGQGDVSSKDSKRIPRKLNLSVPGERVQITYAVPESIEADSKNGSKAHFRKELKQIVDGRLELSLEDEDGPVYVEPYKVSKASGKLTDSAATATSPFGLVAEAELLMASRGNLSQLRNIKDLGVRWVRMSGRAGAVWDLIERAPLGHKNYDWNQMDMMVTGLTQYGFRILCTIKPFHREDQGTFPPEGKLPRHLDKYVQFVRHLAERYDGDGTDDCPGGATVDCWQVHNEMNVPRFWKDTAQAYAELLKATSEAIRDVSPGVEVALGGSSNPGGLYNGPYCTFVDILHELQKNGGRFDVFDVHWYKDYRKHPYGDWTLFHFMNKQLPEVLQKYGFQDVEVWFTEVGTYSGSHVRGRQGLLKPQNEGQQAKDLVGRYVHFLSNGVSKVFWFSMYETNSPNLHGPNDYFNNMGLIHNGVGLDDRGKDRKKKAFFAYRLMTQKLEGAQWNRTQKVQTGEDGVFAYKIFREASKGPVWVVWADSRLSSLKTLRLHR